MVNRETNMAKFSLSEHTVLNLFQLDKEFVFQGKTYKVLKSGKPTSPTGEPKTDIYVLAEGIDGEIEIKISFKQENADFLENKTNAARAAALLGENWSKIISDATKKIEDSFKNRPVVFFNKNGKTDAGSITLGWKFEFLNKAGGGLSGEVPLSKEQKEDIYKGTTLTKEKKDAKVGEDIIVDSGVANYIIMSDVSKLKTIQDAVDALVPIEKYVAECGSIYFACKALNYRSLYEKDGIVVGKYDGDRPLAVYVLWSAKDGYLQGDFVFDQPLIHGGSEILKYLKTALDSLNIKTTKDFDSSILKGVKSI